MYYMTVTCTAKYGIMLFHLIGEFSAIFFIFWLQTQSTYCSSSGPEFIFLPPSSHNWLEWVGIICWGVLRNHGNCFLQPGDPALSLVQGGRNVASCVQICDTSGISAVWVSSVTAARRGRESLFLTGNYTSEPEVALCCFCYHQVYVWVNECM